MIVINSRNDNDQRVHGDLGTQHTHTQDADRDLDHRCPLISR